SDEQHLTICSLAPYTGADAVLALDDDGTELSPITRDSARAVPTVTSAWHGMVCGCTAAGPLVLDGRTGPDRAVTASTAPLLVNESFPLAAASPPSPARRPDYRAPARQAASPTAG
ncbi:hypothetical protein D8M34_17790, partial [Microbacterium sp. HSID17254]|uniref:hypothetical protein n=1 Tax=Microbacterium sp. HSID17254 TaxID=2419509 RepID=UPI000F9AB440